MSEPCRWRGHPLCRGLIAGVLCVILVAGCATDRELTGGEGSIAGSSPKVAHPLLWTGEAAAKDFTIDPEAFNGGSEVMGKTRVDYIGALNADNSYRGSPAEEAEITLIRNVGGMRPDLDGELTLNFENDPLEYFVRQMLGGFLGVNYVAAEELAGTVTFRTEEPIARSQTLAIVRSILAQHGYVMKVIAGVVHIGRPERIEASERLAAVGREGDLVTRVVAFNGVIDESLATSLGAVLPAGIGVALTPDQQGLVVRAAPEEIDEVERLVRSFSDSGAEQNLFAIIYLHDSAPEVMAAKLLAFFSSQSLHGSLAPRSIIPLEGRQALLVSAASESAIENVKRMVAQLDFGLEDEVTLRIIPLRHLGATQIAEQLSSLFGDEGSAPKVSVTDAGIGGAERSADDIETASTDRAGKQSGDADPDNRVAQAFGQRQAATISVDSGGAVSIVADERNNALLVRSSYRIFKRIREAVQVLDVPLSQVVIEATILEVTITDALKYGVQWYLAGSGFTLRNSSTSTVGDTDLTGLVATVEQLASGISVTAVIDALDDVTDVTVVSSPYLTVMDRKTARLVVGDQIPFSTKSQASSDDGTVTVTQEIETRDTGVVLEVQPIIRADNSIELRIVQELSSAELTSGVVNLTPTVSTRQITSEVMVYSGRTVLLGGLIQDRKDDIVTGIPLLREAPVVGKLFEQRSTTDTRTEVVVLITPRVARKSSEIERITEQLSRHLNLSGPYPSAPR